jgi:hypothetical protein
MAMNRKVYNKHFPVHSLSDSFIKNMKNSGRLNEPRLMVNYFLKSGIFKSFSFIPLGMKMASKKRLEYKSSKIKDLSGFRKIINKAQELDMPVEIAARSYMKEAVGYKAVG